MFTLKTLTILIMLLLSNKDTFSSLNICNNQSHLVIAIMKIKLKKFTLEDKIRTFPFQVCLGHYSNTNLSVLELNLSLDLRPS